MQPFLCYVFTPVCHSVHSGADTPLEADTPRADTPRSRHPSDQPPPDQAHPGQTATIADGTHPTEMHSCEICLH